MPPFSRHAGALAESETLAIAARARRLRADGLDIAPFAAGEPDFDTPEHIKEAGIRAIREGRTKYAPAAGIAPLREAVAHASRGRGYEGATAEDTIVSIGAKGVIYLALQVLLEEGDEVIVPAPAWLSYPKMVQAAGARTVFVETGPDGGYGIDPDRVRAAIGPRTRALILNSPGNPTGAVQPDEVQEALGRLAVEHDLLVVADEIYEHLVYEPARFRSFATLAPQARANTLLVSGVSKAYAMTGWRIGYGTGPRGLVERMVRLQSHAFSGAPEICQRAALAALEGTQEPVEEMRRAFSRRRDAMMEFLQGLEDVHCHLPQGAFYMLPDVSRYLGRRFQGEEVGTDARLAELLIEHARAAVVPGHVFQAPYALRFSYACSEEDIRRGMTRVVEFLRDFS